MISYSQCFPSAFCRQDQAYCAKWVMFCSQSVTHITQNRFNGSRSQYIISGEVLSEEENQEEEAIMLGSGGDWRGGYGKVITSISSESEVQFQFPRRSGFRKPLITEE